MNAAQPSELFARRRIIGFLVVGTTSAIATIVLRALLMRFMSFEMAVAISHIVGLSIAFALNGIFVFKQYEGSVLFAYFRFFLVNLLSLAIATATSSFLYRLVFPHLDVGPYADYIAHFCGLGAATVPSYFAHSLFTFRTRRKLA